MQLARTLGKEQVAISQLERRSDMLLSTLRSYVEGMGGSLNLVVQFEGRDAVILRGLGDEDPVAAPRRRTAGAIAGRPKRPASRKH